MLSCGRGSDLFCGAEPGLGPISSSSVACHKTPRRQSSESISRPKCAGVCEQRIGEAWPVGAMDRGFCFGAPFCWGGDSLSYFEQNSQAGSIEPEIRTLPVFAISCFFAL